MQVYKNAKFSLNHNDSLFKDLQGKYMIKKKNIIDAKNLIIYTSYTICCYYDLKFFLNLTTLYSWFYSYRLAHEIFSEGGGDSARPSPRRTWEVLEELEQRLEKETDEKDRWGRQMN